MERRKFIASASFAAVAIILDNHNLQAMKLSAKESKRKSKYWFMHISDTQFGMYSVIDKGSEDEFSRETANMEITVEAINRLQPAYVLITGDLINHEANEKQIAEFKRLIALIDEKIPVFYVPGNHDIGNKAKDESVSRYISTFGYDRFTYQYGDTTIIGINTGVIWGNNIAREKEQLEWLEKELKKASKKRHTIVCGHCPFFLSKADEPDRYEVIPLVKRSTYLDMFDRYDVDIYLAGHLHYPKSSQYKGVRCFTTGAVGFPINSAPGVPSRSGVTLVRVNKEEILPIYFPLEEIPEQLYE